jgi:hypothetical protein
VEALSTAWDVDTRKGKQLRADFFEYEVETQFI